MHKYKCYWIDCKEKVSYKWLGSKKKRPLYVCDEHFNLLTWAYEVESKGEVKGMKTVRVIG